MEEANLRGANLCEANLRGTNLIRADLIQARLRGANLIQADLTGAKLSFADLTGADLTAAHLAEASLTAANLHAADLTGANFTSAHLIQANLRKTSLILAKLVIANLTNAKLSEANLAEANLTGANLTGADLTEANLGRAYLFGTNLTGADLTRAIFIGAIFLRNNLSKTVLRNATFQATTFADLNLTQVISLESCRHLGPSFIDVHTLNQSYNLPIPFLRGCGLSDNFIDYLPSLRGEAIKFYSCFISHSTKDQVFADRLHADLQNKGVRCWFAPHDLPIGAKTWDAIDAEIRLRDKLLLILSEASIASEWVEDEVNKAYAEERSRKQVVLFPIRIDNTVMSTDEPWAVKLRDQRNIGNFRQWKKPEEYEKSLDRLLRDLNASKNA
jgi:uncharacterized protein YjbI with pentapeptide repeats